VRSIVLQVYTSETFGDVAEILPKYLNLSRI
jgi:hypothetical protein